MAVTFLEEETSSAAEQPPVRAVFLDEPEAEAAPVRAVFLEDEPPTALPATPAQIAKVPTDRFEDAPLAKQVFEGAKKVWQSLVRGTGQMVSSLGGAGEMMIDRKATNIYRQAYGKAPMDEGPNVVNRVGEAIAESVPKPTTGTFEPSKADWWLEKLPAVAPQLAAQLGLAALSRGRSVAAFSASGGAMMAGDQYNSALEARTAKGEPPEEAREGAFAEAAIVGTIGAMLERIPGAEYLTKGPFRKLVSEVIGDSKIINAVARGGTEALTETAQELTSIITEAELRGERLDVEMVKNRLKAAATLGGAAGTGASIAIDAVTGKPTATPTESLPPPTPEPSTEVLEEGPPKTAPSVEAAPTEFTVETPSIQGETETSQVWQRAKREMESVATEAPPPVTPLNPERPPVEPPPDFPMVETPEAQMEAVATSEPPPVAPINPEPEPVIQQAPPEPPPVQPESAPSPEEPEIGVRNAITDQIRKAMDLPERVTPATYGEEQQLADAQKAIQDNPSYGSTLVDEVNVKPRNLSTLETNVVLYELAARQTAVKRAVEEVNAATTVEEQESAGERLRAAREQLAKVTEATATFGTEQGRALRARQNLIAEQYEPELMHATIQAAKGEELTPEQSQKVSNISTEITETEKNMAALEDQQADTDAKHYFDNLLVEEGKTAEQRAKAGKTLLDTLKTGHDEALKNIRRRLGQVGSGPDPSILFDVARIGAYHIANGVKKLADFTKAVVAEVGEWIRPNIKEVFNRSKEIHDANQKAFGTPAKAKRGRKPADVAALAAKDAEKGALSHRTAYEMVRQKIQQGVEGFDAVMQAATDDLAKLIPGVTRRQVGAAFSEYGKLQFPSQEDLDVKLREMRRLEQLGQGILDAEEGNPPKASGNRRDKPTQAVREKQAELRRKMAEMGIETESEEEQLASQNQARINALNNQIEDLDKELQTGIKKIKSSPSPKSEEVQRLTAMLDAMRALREEINAQTETPVSEEQKALDRALVARERWSRILSGEDARTPTKRTEALTQLEEDVRMETDAMKAEVARQERESRPKKPAATAQIQQLLKSREKLDRIISGEETPSAPKQFEALSKAAEDLKLEIDAMRELAAQMKRDAKPKTDPAAAKERAQIKALEKAIDEYSRRVREADFAAKTKTTKPDSKRVSELKAIRDSRRSMYEVAKKASLPVKTELEKRVEASLRAIKRSREETERRIREKDFTPKPKRDPVVTKEILDARAKSERLKMEYEEMRADFEFKKLPTPAKLWFGAKQGLRAFVNILSSMDISAPRQAAGYIFNTVGNLAVSPIRSGGPIASAGRSIDRTVQPFVRMFQALWDEKLAARINEKIKDRDNYKNGLDKLSGVQFQNINSPTFSKGEENAFSILDKWAKIPYRQSNLAKTIGAAPFLAGAKGVRASNRAFATFLNVARAMMLDELASIHFKDHKPTAQQIRLIGDAVNLATGRSNVPAGAKTGLRYSGLWSPDLFLSRVQGLLGQPLVSAAVRGEGKVAFALAKEYATTALGAYILLSMSRLFSSDDDEGKSKAVTDPTSSDYGKTIRTGETGDTRVDPFGGFQQPAVLASRLATGEKTDISGKTKELGARDKALLLFNFYRSKLRPTVGVGLDAILGEDYSGKNTKISTAEGAANLGKKLIPVPLAWQETVKLFKQHGLDEAAALQALQILGMGVNNYAEDESALKPSR